MMTFITANGFMVTYYDSEEGISIRVRANMLHYLEMFGLDEAEFQIGHATIRLSRKDILAD